MPGALGAEHYAKLCICVEEANETQFWLELPEQAETIAASRLALLRQEYDSITAILTAARQKAK